MWCRVKQNLPFWKSFKMVCWHEGVLIQTTEKCINFSWNTVSLTEQNKSIMFYNSAVSFNLLETAVNLSLQWNAFRFFSFIYKFSYQNTDLTLWNRPTTSFDLLHLNDYCALCSLTGTNKNTSVIKNMLIPILSTGFILW